jgi:hypothetical protein
MDREQARGQCSIFGGHWRGAVYGIIFLHLDFMETGLPADGQMVQHRVLSTRDLIQGVLNFLRLKAFL